MPNSNLHLNLIRFSSLFIFLFTLISIVFDLHELYLLEKGYPFFNYMQNDVIRTIYHVSITLKVIVAVLSVLIAINIEQNVSWMILFPVIAISLILSFLIWYEIYYGSTFYYGEVRDKQALFFSTNSFGVYGSTVYLNYALILGIFYNSKFLKLKSISIILLGILVYAIQYSFFRLMEEHWRLWSS